MYLSVIVSVFVDFIVSTNLSSNFIKAKNGFFALFHRMFTVKIEIVNLYVVAKERISHLCISHAMSILITLIVETAI